jgi:NAD(P)-dependent dehydrogenase (short-subunit alcohol dehydrogenase family)|tara:strand:- start:1164 stop:1847 length:684 start_codon:yes stop_codon:yes gene_type:complete
MIIITGASSGVGKFLFDTYTELGEEVYGTYNKSVPETTKHNGHYNKVDIVKYDEVENWIKSISLLKDIVLINCAGITYNAFAHKADVELWKNVIDVNLTGTYNVIRTILPLMREDNFGRIINFSSVVAQKATPGISAYAASKSALWGMAKSISIENASKGITINNINLGYSELGMIKQVPEKYKAAIKAGIPSGEFCQKEDVFKCVEFVRKNNYLNGSSIDLNGGIF